MANKKVIGMQVKLKLKLFIQREKQVEMLTTNYNVVQVSADDKDKYHVVDVFTVPNQFRTNWRFMKFDGLVIQNISYGFGIFLHFTWYEWEKNHVNLGAVMNELYYQSKGLNLIL